MSRKFLTVTLLIGTILIAIFVRVNTFTLKVFGTEDAYTYVVKADIIKNAKGLAPATFYQLEPRVFPLGGPPLYPLLVAFFSILIPTGLAAKLLSSLFSLLAIVFFFLLLRDFFKSGFLAILGALTLALEPHFIFTGVQPQVEALIVFLSVCSVYCLLKYEKTERVGFVYLSVLCAGLLSSTHLIGFIFSFVTWISIAILYFSKNNKINRFVKLALPCLILWLVISSWWILYSAVQTGSLPGSIVIYKNTAGSLVGIGQTKTQSVGLRYWTVIQDFIPTQSLYVFFLLGLVSSLRLLGKNRCVVIFYIWFFAVFLVSIFLPFSYSHFSRYPLQFLPAVIFFAMSFLWYVFNYCGRDLLLKQIISLLVLVHLLVVFPLQKSKISTWQHSVMTMYRPRCELGLFLKDRNISSNILYAFWPSIIHSYKSVPMKNLIDYQTIIMNGENPADVILKKNVDYIVWDNSSNDYYGFAERTFNLLPTPLVSIELIKSFDGGVKLYEIKTNKEITKRSYPVNSDSIQLRGFSGLKEQDFVYSKGGIPLGLKQIRYCLIESDDATVAIPMSSQGENKSVVYFRMLIQNFKTGFKVYIKSEYGERLVLAVDENLLGWWGWNYYKINIKESELSNGGYLTLIFRKATDDKVALSEVVLY